MQKWRQIQILRIYTSIFSRNWKLVKIVAEISTEISLDTISRRKKKKNKKRIFRYKCAFRKKKKERRENTGDIVIPGMDGEKKAGGCCFRKSSSFRMVAQGRKREGEGEGEREASAILGHSTSCNPCNRVRLCETLPDREIGSTLSPRWKPPAPGLPRVHPLFDFPRGRMMMMMMMIVR